ncbi:NAD(P)-dependent alcohol dehydrogenase [Pelagicoccus sp. SDUM812003]|uniref:NAD(P)-dependent alcohol dehydrogenase n=1 Tax=Pelagicoccus sp. SDUM812003 TaxID=3041267 RepID=UPI00280F122C|nr:NAD(P)-dependent alcohol dehydrogenase [Pelagicoccus sp. SDUM812003]MDQ8204763.1 NAD(P)-dependent alcohol dehydrogenase [Pelagicoccus sp. SDUM812003]
MKAVAYQRYGPPEVLAYRDLPDPTPKEGEILVRVHAAEVTKADCEMRSFRFPVFWFWLPLRLGLGVFRPRNPVLGSYFSGEVVSTNHANPRFAPGDQIYGSSQFSLGAYGEYLCLPQKRTLAKKPPNVSHAEAAAVPLGGLNALHFLRLAKIRPEQSVLINGGGGSIGLFAIQIAKSMGAHVTVVDKPQKETVIRRAGADRFIDYTRLDFRNEPHAYHVIFDMVVRSPYSKTLSALVPDGCYLKGNVRFLDFFRALFTSLFSQKRAYVRFAAEAQHELDTLTEWIEEGRIRSLVDRVFPFSEAAQAHHIVEMEQRDGAIILQPDRRDEAPSAR